MAPMDGVVVEYIVYTDRHENFPRDTKRKVRIVAVAGCPSDIRHELLTLVPIYAAEYNMRFHVQSAGISLLGETIYWIYNPAADNNYRYADYLRARKRTRAK